MTGCRGEEGREEGYKRDLRYYRKDHSANVTWARTMDAERSILSAFWTGI